MAATAPQAQHTRVRLDDLTLSPGKKARLHRLLYQYGPGNGTLMVLPIDQGLEHGPVDFFDNPPSEDPDFQFQLALEGRYSAIAVHIGLAEKYFHRYAGRVPLILKLNGKTCVPPDDNAFSPMTSSVEDAVRLGADAVGYTVYVGSPAQDIDIQQFNEVRRDAERFGMPVVVWAYPRGQYINEKGGKNSFYAVQYAARVACELGADVVKVNFPEVTESKRQQYPKPYNEFNFGFEEMVRRVVHSAGKTLVIFSGGGKISQQELLEQVRVGIRAGGAGLIFGRNMWQRPMDEALDLTRDIQAVLREEAAAN
ncbi:MAG: fructose-bisphosphate aldolase [Candidatus Melainabacteria bacterium]|nr:fructose-bisphosphate aldolase [Candidatus Melainabacteria bacterium]